MPVHVALLAVPAVSAGFLQAFQFAFVLWPFNLALPLARHLPRASIVLRGAVSFYHAELRRYHAARHRAAGPVPVQQQQQRMDGEDAVAHAMVALVGISY